MLQRNEMAFQQETLRTQGRNGLQFCIMYPDHYENWLDYGHSLLIFLILAQYLFSEMGQICCLWAFHSESIGGMAWNPPYILKKMNYET